jgi:hypothetical protein
MEYRPNTMTFLPQLKEFLDKTGGIYTVRHYLMKTAEILVLELPGRFTRTYICEINKRTELEDYLDKSGFKTVDEWWTKIYYFTGNGKKYLYHIERINDKGT